MAKTGVRFRAEPRAEKVVLSFSDGSDRVYEGVDAHEFGIKHPDLPNPLGAAHFLKDYLNRNNLSILDLCGDTALKTAALHGDCIVLYSLSLTVEPGMDVPEIEGKRVDRFDVDYAIRPIADEHLGETHIIKPGDRFHRLISRMADTYYDDLTDERIEQLERQVDEWRWMHADTTKF
eukprot:jgi/Tetstr1/450616/TSEL_037652.t1